MFAATSRYISLETSNHTLPDGREVRYVRRRFLPHGGNLPLLVEVTVEANDRLDAIAVRTIGDPEQFWHVADGNNAMNPFDLLVAGRVLRITLPQVQQP